MKINDLPLLPLSYLTKEEVLAIEEMEFSSGTSAYELMLKAGKGVADYIINSELDKKSIIVISGSGNNGGDGAVAARFLSEKYFVEIVYVKEPKTEQSKQAMNDLGDKVNKYILNKSISFEDLIDKIKSATIIVDAILGIGVQSDVRNPYKEIIDQFSQIDNSAIISVDIPSGMDTNSGKWYVTPFTPYAIVTMQFSKRCMQTLQGINIHVVDIGINKNYGYFTSEHYVKHLWPKRDPNSHKGMNGRVMVIGGSDEFTGAPVLSGMAVLRAGVDTLRIAVPETIRNIVAGYAKDFIVVKVNGSRITSKPFKKYQEMAVKRHDVIVVGMGMSNHPDCNKFTREFFEYAHDKVKFVLDAEAVRAFKGNLNKLKNTNTIITPHRAELRMMLGEDIPDDFGERIDFLQKKAAELGITILLKGQYDIITNGQRTIINKSGHPGMTVGGTGDVLAGLTAACYSFIDDPVLAASVAAFIMGKSGEAAAELYGNSLLASDIITFIPKILLKYNVNK